jgi:pimeloyl-ACP methyl ester carboxylesterase
VIDAEAQEGKTTGAATKKKGVLRRIRKIGAAAAGVLAGLALLGAGYQHVGQARDRRAAPAPGRMLEVDGAAMHIHCTGTGAPTIVLEAGATGFAQMWAWVQPRLAERTRVCSYDRAGMGWSEDADGHDGASIAKRLRALLDAAGEHGPYMLAGHSVGGAFIRIFAERYPADVVALALIDPSHPDQLDRFPPEARAGQQRFAKILSVAAKLSYVGLPRATNLLGRLTAGVPADHDRTARMFISAPQHLRTSAEELLAWDATMDAARDNRTLGDRPVVVISSTNGLKGMSQAILELGQQMNAEIAALSARGRHVMLDGADHLSLLLEREDAERVAESLGETLAEVRRLPSHEM